MVNIESKENILKLQDALRDTPENKRDEFSAIFAYAATRVDNVDDAIQLARDAMEMIEANP